MGPPLVVGLPECLNRIGGVDRSFEGPELREAPSDSSKHGRSSVGKLGLAKVIDRCPLGQFKGIELWDRRNKIIFGNARGG